MVTLRSSSSASPIATGLVKAFHRAPKSIHQGPSCIGRSRRKNNRRSRLSGINHYLSAEEFLDGHAAFPTFGRGPEQVRITDKERRGAEEEEEEEQRQKAEQEDDEHSPWETTSWTWMYLDRSSNNSVGFDRSSCEKSFSPTSLSF
ncbi:hypothetical protein GWI33_001547 [Rhynchophorus ferrugineus]|uniref:Uncharacterized protein n=1 Tax=Rhynchophorus ferrugineus TaxID=354439 RepID=A0A834ILN8_RHYFE|nr:hypothetical protein GWI33_001547 [Rhynchophorus ferrugineus]